MRAGIRTKLVMVALALLGLAVLVAALYLRRELTTRLTERIYDDLLVRARLVAMDAGELARPATGRERWESFAVRIGRVARVRVTIMDAAGVVLADSDVAAGALSKVENHADRPEVRAALRGEQGFSQRRSATINQRLLYVAVPIRAQGRPFGVARVALPLTEVDAALAELHRGLAIALLLALLVAALLATLAAHFASKTARELTEVARQMAAGDLRVRTHVSGSDELGALGGALDSLAEGLSGSLRELEAQRDKLGGILAGMQEGVLLIGRDHRVALVNPALRELFLLESGVEGRSPIEVIRNAELIRLLEAAEAQGQAVSGELELVGLRPRRLLVHVVPIAGEGGGLLAVFVDVTHLRRLESVRKDFVANASHELRTPIAAVLSAAETLEQALAQDPPAAALFLSMIRRNSERLRSIVEDMLDLSRIEAPGYRLQPEPVEVERALRAIALLSQQRAADKQVTLVVEVDPSAREAHLDPRALEQVVHNLVDNAVKYCPPGSRVVLRAARAGGALSVEVDDNGPGIEAHHLPRLFERFYRVDPGRSRELGGTGLGLAIVKHLVDAMGGIVGVESTVGKGTRFRISLPGDRR